MSADRELLELAAKAAGVVGKWTTGYHAYGTLYIEGIDTGTRFWWNPLTDDGDALRLAVKLKLIVTFADGGAGPHVCAGRRLGPFSDEPIPIVHFLDQQEKDLAATRRAIVRAAAEIGRAMP